MALDIVRRIRGNLHGSVEVSALEDLVIAHPLMQRLRRIKQTAFLSLVFPSATHSRFEHSLGVLHLAGIAWDKIWRNQERLGSSCKKYADFAMREQQSTGKLCHGLLSPTFGLVEKVIGNEYIEQAVRLAALMHDLGHPPFSHSGERFAPLLEKLLDHKEGIPDYLALYFEEKVASDKKSGKKRRASHEMYTLIFTHKILTDIYQQNPSLKLKVDPRDIIAIINPQVPLAAKSPLKEYNFHLLCHEIVSGEIDVDRMDYLLRDSQESGVIYGIFDVNRILDSLVVYFDPLEKGLHLAIQYSGLAAFEDYLRARHSMYLQLYFHKTSVAAEAMLKNLAMSIGGYALPSDYQVYGQIDEYNIYELLKSEGRKHIKDAKEQDDFNQSLRDLLLDRRLWKRVFEINTSKLTEQENSLLERVGNLIQSMGIKFERISSATTLTRFSPRSEDQLSDNYLRLIKKDPLQFPRVIPIEDFSDLIKNNSSRQIHRIYIKNEIKEGITNYQKVQEAMLQEFHDENAHDATWGFS